MKREWWKEGVVYQIYPRSFADSNNDGIGDLPGIISKLDYLKELGIDIIWLSPVYSSPNDDNGYDISNYRQIMEEFGTIKDMDELIRQAHRREIKLLMDLVVNHTSDEHRWFAASRSSCDNPYRNYYIWRPGRRNKEGRLLPPNNWSSRFGGSAWQYDRTSGEYYLHLFSPKQPDLNWDNPEVRQAVYRMMHWWLKKGIDGFRMDVINMISKSRSLPDGEILPGETYSRDSSHYINGPNVHLYLQEMNQQVLSHYDIMTVGETPAITPEAARKYVESDRGELNMIFHFETMEIDRQGSKWKKREWKLTELKALFNKWYYTLKDKGWNSLYLNNHDQPRMVSRFGDDRLYRRESAKMLATLLHTFPGTPYIYQGEEIGMTNVHFPGIEDYRDIETLNFYCEQTGRGVPEDQIMSAIHRSSRDNARTPIQWNDGPRAGFSGEHPWIKVNPAYREINVSEARRDPDSVYHYYRQLIQMRKNNPIIVYGSYHPLMVDDEQIFAYLRQLEGETLLVMLNFSAVPAQFLPADEIAYQTAELLLANYPDIEETGSRKAAAVVNLKPYEARVYRLN